MIKYFALYTLVILSSCGYFFGQNNTIKFTCNHQKNISLTPPEGTFKCSINVNQICNMNDTLVLFLRGHKLREIAINDLGVIYQSDWYGDELGISFLPNSSFIENGSTIINVKFFH